MKVPNVDKHNDNTKMVGFPFKQDSLRIGWGNCKVCPTNYIKGFARDFPLKEKDNYRKLDGENVWFRDPKKINGFRDPKKITGPGNGFPPLDTFQVTWW